MRQIPYGHQSIDSRDIKEVVRVLRSDWISQGPKIREFEDALCAYTGARYAVAVSSGTAALHVACLAAGIRPKAEVITSPITFVASANCILYCGGRPVFADIREDTVHIDPEEIRKKVTKNTGAVIPVHFAGLPCDLEGIAALAKKHDLIVIEDAAHALGARYKHAKIGSCRYSDMTIFSFHPIKAITTGEGGAVTTNDKKLYEKLCMLRNHGITRDASRFARRGQRNTGGWYYEMQELGFNYRITDFQCALGVSQLRKIDRFIEKRRKIAALYDRQFKDIEGLSISAETKDAHSSRHMYVIRLRSQVLKKNRRHIYDILRSKKIQANVHYMPVYRQPYYARRFGYTAGLCPIAESFYEEALTLPLFPDMSGADIRHVVRTFTDTLKSIRQRHVA